MTSSHSKADLVMPWFDFIVGVSLAISFKKFDRPKTPKRTAFTKATVRFAKIFILGILTQCGISLIEFNMSKLRIMGILQRVAVCYYVVALMEIFLPRNVNVKVVGIESSQGGNLRYVLLCILLLLFRSPPLFFSYPSLT